MHRCLIRTRNGELYRTDLRYFRQQVLREREQALDPYVSQLRVRLFSPWDDDLFVDAVVRTRDLYLIALGGQDCEFVFKDHVGSKQIGRQVPFGFTGHYKDLGSYTNLRVTQGSVNAAIENIARWRASTVVTTRRKDQLSRQRITAEAGYILTMVLVICESARFFDIEKTVANALDGHPGTPLGPAMIDDLVHRWDAYSKEPKGFLRVAIPNMSA